MRYLQKVIQPDFQYFKMDYFQSQVDGKMTIQDNHVKIHLWRHQLLSFLHRYWILWKTSSAYQPPSHSCWLNGRHRSTLKRTSCWTFKYTTISSVSYECSICIEYSIRILMLKKLIGALKLRYISWDWSLRYHVYLQENGHLNCRLEFQIQSVQL